MQLTDAHTFVVQLVAMLDVEQVADNSHTSWCGWHRDWHACGCGAFDRVGRMAEHGDELRQAAESKPSGLDQARAFVWRHRTFFAPLVGILAAKLCPLLGWAAGPCAIVGDALHGSLTP